MSIYFLAYPVYSCHGHLTRYRPSLFTHRALVLQADFEYRKPAGLPADIQLQGQLINTWFSPRRRFNNKKHAGWLMINILVINIRRYP